MRPSPSGRCSRSGSPRRRQARGANWLAWRSFAAFVGVPVDELEATLLELDYPTAFRLLSRWQVHLSERERLSPATVNNRTSAVQSWAKYANRAGVLPWRVAVDPLKAEPYRDVRGPAVDDVGRILAYMQGLPDRFTRARDVALLLVLFTLGLRRSEVSRLDVEDLDLTTGSLEVKRKGRRETRALTVPVRTRRALAAWLKVRDRLAAPASSALFLNASGERLRPEGVYYRVRQWGKAVGLSLRPHKLRHAGCTAALDATGDLRGVQSWGGWSDPKVLDVYDDARQDRAGAVAEVLAGLI